MINESKSIRVLIPIQAQLYQIFPKRKDLDKAKAVFYHLHGRWMLMQANDSYAPAIDRDSRYVPISGKDLRYLIGNDYKRIIDLLIKHNLIEIKLRPNGKRSYTPGVYSMLYRVRLRQKNKQHPRQYRIERITDQMRIKRIRSFYNRGYDHQRKLFLKENGWYAPHLDFIDNLYLADGAIEYAESKGDHADHLLGIITRFNSKDSRFIKRDIFGERIHHSLSILNSVTRPFIRLKGSDDSLILLDAASAQPYLIGAMLLYPKLIDELLPEFTAIKPMLSKYQNKPSTKLFFSDCALGKFNERWMELTGLKKTPAKKLLFRHVFYSSRFNNHKDEAIREERMKTRMLFRSVYPSILDALDELKSIRKESMPWVYELSKSTGCKRGRMFITAVVALQRMESRLFQDRISKRLAECNVLCGTIHDAWLIKQQDIEIFTKVFHNVFAELGIPHPKLKIG